MTARVYDITLLQYVVASWGSSCKRGLRAAARNPEEDDVLQKSSLKISGSIAAPALE